ncbi:MAG: dephospho-CoA kinase [Spirochaetales bacterium]|nr:dephospho-CoA kinase [Spirochaetales bacterium]
MVIGVTGKYCSGKNIITRLIAARNFTEIDVDTIGHEVLSQKSREVIASFGQKITDADGSINRRKLGRIVFADKKKRQALERLLHPEMTELIKQQILLYKNAVINAALLFPMKLDSLCDAVIIVRSPLIQRIFRAKKRDRLDFCEIIKRFLSQLKILSNKTTGNVDIYNVDNRFDEIACAVQLENIMKNLSSDF